MVNSQFGTTQQLAAYFEDLNYALFSIPWDFTGANSPDFTIALDNITDIIDKCAELHIPTKIVRHICKHDKSWVTNGLKQGFPTFLLPCTPSAF